MSIPSPEWFEQLRDYYKEERNKRSEEALRQARESVANIIKRKALAREFSYPIVFYLSKEEHWLGVYLTLNEKATLVDEIRQAGWSVVENNIDDEYYWNVELRPPQPPKPARKKFLGIF